VGARHKAGHDEADEETMARFVTLTAALFFALMASARADDYPSKPIHVLTTSSAGGISDIFMRVLGEELHKSLGQPLIIDNRPGGAGNIAARACQDAPPDTPSASSMPIR
jgi:tripartite-type tricarboxylate transporter receptor subunit TctC